MTNLSTDTATQETTIGPAHISELNKLGARAAELTNRLDCVCARLFGEAHETFPPTSDVVEGNGFVSVAITETQTIDTELARMAELISEVEKFI